jgi:hypothetical protein
MISVVIREVLMIRYIYMNSSQTDDSIIKFTQEKYQNLDMIVDLYAMQVLWTSEKLAQMLGYNQNEITNVSIRKILDVNPKEMQRLIIGTYLGKSYQEKIIAKSGNIITCQGNVHSYLYERDPYVAITNVTLATS